MTGGRGPARRVVLVVLDGVGAGAAPDAAAYGDQGSNTLGNTARAVGGMRLPNLERMGLGRAVEMEGVRSDRRPSAAHGVMRPASAGKDSITGHWELMGIHLDRPFPTYPSGFPQVLVDAFARATGRPVIGNIAASGTEVLERFGAEHETTGAWIVYTSADSVFQVAAHEDIVPIEELYAACETVRRLLVPPHNVARVIARPFAGASSGYIRTASRRDFSVSPPGETVLDALQAAGVSRYGVGKVDDLFAGRGIEARHTGSNAEGIRLVSEWLQGAPGGFLFANLIDFDQQYGHRNDPNGFYDALRELDAAIPRWLGALEREDLLIITADHGTDPTTNSTDHSREYVPVLVAGPMVSPTPLGIRESYSDVGATVADAFGVSFRGAGRSFLSDVLQGSGR